MSEPPQLSLPSPYLKTKGLFHFARMLEKARLHSKGELPEDYQSLRGNGFDGRLCRFIGVDYEAVVQKALVEPDNEAVLKWCYQQGQRPTNEEILIFNSFVSKRGWRDDESAEFVPEIIESYGMDDDGSILTDFDVIEVDEGRPINRWADAWGIDPIDAQSGLPRKVRELAQIFIENNNPLSPIPTSVEPILDPIKGIKAVVFDIYGTLFISGSGDIGVSKPVDSDAAIKNALKYSGFRLSADASEPLSDQLTALVKQAHAKSRDQGIEYPEVEIREIWRDLIDKVTDIGSTNASPEQIASLAIRHECEINPVWPMPHLVETLAALRMNGHLLGIVSNAQFYTRFLFPAFTGQPLTQLGFNLDCSVFSYQLREGKPSRTLYQDLLAKTAHRGIEANEILYIGNDMRNDIWPAKAEGMHTVLFAGDERSLRWRKEDPRVAELRPDRIITDLHQLLAILDIGHGKKSASGE